MAITATVDRFEGEIAVLIVEPEQTVVNVSREDLPEGVSQGDVLRLEGTVNREETERRRSYVQKKLRRLKARGGPGEQEGEKES